MAKKKKVKNEEVEEAPNLGGRPPLFTDPKELQEKIDDYFQSGVNEKEIITKLGTKERVPVPTISGLCYHLGFESRQSFYDYEKTDGFSYTIKRARLFIENEYESQLQIGNTTGAIFALKNMGWIDKLYNDFTSDGDSISPIQWVKDDQNK